MSKSATQNYVRVAKDEYRELKKLKKSFGAFLEYFEYLRDIKGARDDTKAKRTISQEKLFKELGV